MIHTHPEIRTKTLTATGAKYGFGRLIDFACGEPVAMEKHGPPDAVMMAIEDFERLKARDTRPPVPMPAGNQESND